MNENLMNGLTELVNYTVQTLTETTDLVISNAPIIVQDLITYKTTSLIIGEILCLGIIIFTVLLTRQWIKNDKLDIPYGFDINWYRAALGLLWLLSIVSIILFICDGFALVKWITSPKLAVMDYLKQMLYNIK